MSGENESERVPSGPKCWSCGAVATLSYSHLSWTELLSKARSDSKVAAEITDAKELLSRRGPPPTSGFMNEALTESSQMHISVQRSLLFISQAELEAEHNIRVPVEQLAEITDEHGKKLRGILKVNPLKPHREILITRQAGFDLSKTLCSQELRPQQNRELLQHLHGEEQKSRSKHWKNPMDEAELKLFIEQYKGLPKSEAAEQGAESVAPLARAEDGEEANNGGERQAVLVSELPMNLLVSRGEDAEGKKPKAKAKAKGQKRATGAAGAAAPSVLLTDTKKRRTSLALEKGDAEMGDVDKASLSSYGGSSKVASVALSSKSSWKRGGEAQRFEAQAEKYRRELRPESALIGVSIKTPMYQARRIITAMQEHDAEQGTNLVASQPCIQLKAHMELMEMCEEASRLPSLSASRCSELLERISTKVDPLPSPFQCTIIVTRVQALQWVQSKDVETWMSLAQPFPDEGYLASNH